MNVISKYLLISLLCVFSRLLSLNAQHLPTDEITLPSKEKYPSIYGPKSLSDSSWEYSGLGKWNNQIVLLPQYPDRFYGIIPLVTINFSKTPLMAENVELITMVGFDIKQYSEYQGLEAVAIHANTFYFSVETGEKNDFCYIIKGDFNPEKRILEVKKTKQRLKKPKKAAKLLENMGFESLVYMKERNELLAIFEYNEKNIDGNRAFLLDENLTKKDSINIDLMDLRLTDVNYFNGSLIGINHCYKNEKGVYNPPSKLLSKDIDWANSIYTRLVKLEIKPENSKIEKITWESFLTVNDGCLLNKLGKSEKFPPRLSIYNDKGCVEDNWEGLVEYQGHLLMVTDEYVGSKLIAVKLTSSLEIK